MTGYKCRNCSHSVEKEGDACEICKLRLRPSDSPHAKIIDRWDWIVLGLIVVVSLIVAFVSYFVRRHG